jgi:ABC-type bacteriocin/lantibiotic exporter with double-glycine peptidase domain
MSYAGRRSSAVADAGGAPGVKITRTWWAPPVDRLSASLVRHGMPPTLFGFVGRVSAWSQVWVACLAVAIFILNTAPLEMQRRILNAAVLDGDVERVLVLASIYAGIVLGEGLVKLLMNVYRGWVGEKAVRVLRLAASALVDSMPEQRHDAGIQGVEISLILPEPEPIGGFVGVVYSEFVLQAGTLLSAFAYMFFMQPVLAFTCLVIFLPQLVFVPLMQAAINRRVQARIQVLRAASVDVLATQHDDAAVARVMKQELRFAEIFSLNLGVVKLRYSMHFFMNLTHNFAKVIVLGVGGWYVIDGQTEVGTVVAFVSGLNNVHDPWAGLVAWYEDMMVTRARYRTFVDAMEQFAKGEARTSAT